MSQPDSAPVEGAAGPVAASLAGTPAPPSLQTLLRNLPQKMDSANVSAWLFDIGVQHYAAKKKYGEMTTMVLFRNAEEKEKGDAILKVSRCAGNKVSSHFFFFFFFFFFLYISILVKIKIIKKIIPRFP